MPKNNDPGNADCKCADGYSTNGNWNGSTSTISICTLKNKYVNFDLNSATSGAPSATSVNCSYNVQCDFPTQGTLARTGYVFQAWSEDSAIYCPGDPDGSYFNKKYTAEPPNTLYACWNPECYVMTLDKNNGTGGTDTIYQRYGVGWGSTASCVGTLAPSGSAVTGMTAPTRTGYDFAGYNASGGTSVISADLKSQTAALSSSQTLTAQWTAKTAQITFSANGGVGAAPSSITCTYGQSCALPAMPAFTKAGYLRVAQWCVDAAGTGTCYNAGDSITSAFESAATLYAKWTPCGPGTFTTNSDAASCTLCEANSYSIGAANTSCSVCAGGTPAGSQYAASTTSSTCTNCANKTGAETYHAPDWNNNSPIHICEIATCANGYYKNGNACSPCSNGPAPGNKNGTFEYNGPGTTAFDCPWNMTCGSGQRWDGAACAPCVAGTAGTVGTINSVAGGGLPSAAPCATNCGPGKYSAAAGALSCTDCAIGSRSTGTNNTGCVACQPNDATGTDGTTSGDGQSACNASCGKAGVYTWAATGWTVNQVSNPCTVTACMAGFYKGAGNDCTACNGILEYQPNHSQTACAVIEIGEYKTSNTTKAQCTILFSGTMITGPSTTPAPASAQCPAPAVCATDDCPWQLGCDVGEKWTGSACAACDKGTARGESIIIYNTNFTANPCPGCVSGKYQDQTGQSICKTCPSNTKTDAGTATAAGATQIEQCHIPTDAQFCDNNNSCFDFDRFSNGNKCYYNPG